MALVRRLVELGRAARAESKVEDPAAAGPRAGLGAAAGTRCPTSCAAQVARRAQRRVGRSSRRGRPGRRQRARRNFRALGKRFGKRTPGGRRGRRRRPTRRRGAGGRLARSRVDGRRRVGRAVAADEVVVTETPRAGWAVAPRPGETVALDLELTDELRRAGLVRDVVRLVQDARKAQGFDVSDRIELWWSGRDARARRGAARGHASGSPTRCWR